MNHKYPIVENNIINVLLAEAGIAKNQLFNKPNKIISRPTLYRIIHEESLPSTQFQVKLCELLSNGDKGKFKDIQDRINNYYTPDLLNTIMGREEETKEKRIEKNK